MTESDKNLNLVVCGMYHQEFNLQGIFKIVASFEESLQSSPDDSLKVLYYECPTGSQKWKDQVTGIINEQGYLGFTVRLMMADQTGHQPRLFEVERRIKEITDVGLDEAVSRRLLPRNRIQQFYLFAQLDRLREAYGFVPDLETHTKPILDRLAAIDKQVDPLSGLMQNQWIKGDFEEALSTAKHHKTLMDQTVNLREREMVEYLGERSKKVSRSKRDGLIFALFGDHHISMIDPLGRRLRNYPNINIQGKNYPPEEQLAWRMNLLSRAGEEIPDLLHAQDLFKFILMTQLGVFALQEKRVTMLGAHYEDIYDEINRIASRLSIEELRETRTGDFSPGKFLLSVPDAEHTKALLS